MLGHAKQGNLSEFLRGVTTAQAARTVNVFGTEIISQPTIPRWFTKLRSGNFDLSTEVRVDNDQLKAVEEANLRQDALELSLIFAVTKKTI